MCLCACICTLVCRNQWNPEQGVGYLGTLVIGGCEPVGIKSQPWVTVGRAASALHYRAISPALQTDFVPLDPTVSPDH